MANCHKCGAPLKANKQFCAQCGETLSRVAIGSQPGQPQTPSGVMCPKCAAAVPAGKRFCTQCGTTITLPQQVQTVTGVACPKCGAAVPKGKRFCTQCGHTFDSGTQTTSPVVSVSQPSIPFKPQTVANVKCDRCGATVPAGKRFCTTCGKPVEVKSVEVFRPSPYPQSPTATVEVRPIQVKPEGPAPIVQPAPRKSAPARGPLLRMALAVAAVVVVAAGLFAIYTLFIRKPVNLDDQHLLETYYGPPPFFTVILARDESQQPAKLVRREVWIYPDRKASFVLLDGKYQFSSDLKSVGKSVARAASKLRIEQVTESLTVDDLSKLVGNKPVSLVNLPKELPEAIRYEFGGGINAVFSQGRLLMVQTMPAQEGK